MTQSLAKTSRIYTEGMRHQAEAMTEAELGKQIGRCYEQFGWRSYHTHILKRSNFGFPDEFVVKPDWDSMFWAELKRERRPANKATGVRGYTPKISKAQIEWLDDLASIEPSRVFLFMPRDWVRSAIQQFLATRDGWSIGADCLWELRRDQLVELGINVVEK